MFTVPNRDFSDFTDAHIMLSNKQLESSNGNVVHGAMMNATTRYGAWLAAEMAPDKAEMQESREKTIEFFTAEFQRRFTEHFDDYLNNFERFKATGRTADLLK